MAPESVISKSISLKDSLSKVPLEHKPTIEFFAECIDRHRELSLDQRRQWLTFVVFTYEPPGSIKKPIKTNKDVSGSLGIPEIKVKEHLKALEDFPDFDNLWEALEKEINKEAKKKPDLFKSSRTRQAPVSQETVDKVKKLIKVNATNAKIAQDVGLPVGRIHYLGRKLLANKEIESRSRKNPKTTTRS